MESIRLVLIDDGLRRCGLDRLRGATPGVPDRQPQQGASLAIGHGSRRT